MFRWFQEISEGLLIKKSFISRYEKILSWGQWINSKNFEILWEKCLGWQVREKKVNERSNDRLILKIKEKDCDH